MKTKSEILGTLPQYYGTEGYHRWSILFPKFVMTDGVKYLVDAAECYWLVDAIASHRNVYHDSGFATAKLSVKDSRGKLKILDGNDKVLARQEIPYTDFPLDEITLFVIDNGDFWVILLTSEY